MDTVEQVPIDVDGERSYPIVATVFGLLRVPLDSARQRRTVEFVRWTLTRGASIGDRLGYSRLPGGVVRQTGDKLGFLA